MGRPLVLRPDDRLGSYLIEGDVGHGAIGTVVRARHVVLGSLHAIKVLRVDDPDARRRLLDEGRAQARLHHPNVVRVTDILDVDGRPALVMDLVRGPTLARLLGRVRPSIPEVERIFRGIVAGVAAAHEAGIVHHDLKPGNVLLDTTQQPPVPLVADFGIASAVGGAVGRGGIGTPGYVPPERIGEDARPDPRADVFALGVLLVELVTGRRPFPAEVVAAAAEGHEPDPWEAPPGFPPRLATVAAACLRWRPEGRPADAGGVLGLLDSASPTPPAATPVPAPTLAPALARSEDRGRGSRWLLERSAAAAAGVVAVVALALGLSRAIPSGAPPQEAARWILDGWARGEDRPAEALALLLAAGAEASDAGPQLIAELRSRGAAQQVFGMGEPAVSVAVSDRFVVAASVSGVVRAWRRSDGAPVARVHTGVVQPRDLRLLPGDVGFVVSPHERIGKAEGDALAWSLPSGVGLVRAERAGQQRVEVAGERIVSVVSVGSTPTLAAWGLDGAPAWSVPLSGPSPGRPTAVGDRIAVPFPGETVVFALADGVELARWPVEAPRHYVTLSPDGAYLAESTSRGTELRRVAEPAAPAVARISGTQVAFSPSSSRALAVDLAKRQVDVVDLAAGSLRPIRTAGAGIVTAAFVGEDRVVTGGVDGEVAVWDVGTGEAVWRLHGHRSSVVDVVATAGGWASASLDGTVRLWSDPASGHEALEATRMLSDPAAGRWLVRDGVVGWIGGGRLRVVRLRDGESREVAGLDPDVVLLGLGPDGSAVLHDERRRTLVVPWGGAPREVEGPAYPRYGTWSLDGRWFLVSGRDRYAVYAAGSGEAIAGGPVRDIYLSASFLGSSLFVAHGAGGDVDTWRLDPARRGPTLRPPWTGTRGVSVLASAPDGGWNLLGAYGGEAVAWRTEDAALVPLGKVGDDVLHAAVADAGRAVVAARDGSVGLWDLRRGTRIAGWRIPGRPSAVALHGDVVWVGDSRGRLHRLQGGRREVLPAHAGWVRAIVVDEAGIVRTLGEDGYLRAWRVERDGPGDTAVGAATNLRVCAATGEVVPVVPFPARDARWAPVGCGDAGPPSPR